MTQSVCTTSPDKMACSEVLAAIEENGGPGGVEFAGCNLSDIQLDFKTLRELYALNKVGKPVWWSNSTHGVNLRGARLIDADLQRANLVQADLTEATLYGANLQDANLHDSSLKDSFLVRIEASNANFTYCDMQGCHLLFATLTNADLSNARLQNANLSNAVLSSSRLCHAKLIDVDLTDADLRGADLYGAWLVGTFLTREQIGDCIIQENDKFSVSDKGDGTNVVPGRFAQASSIYRSLKNNFLSIGSYSDASWAYVKERKMRKNTHWPPEQIRKNYPVEVNKLPQKGLRAKLARLRFFSRHWFAWAVDCV